MPVIGMLLHADRVLLSRYGNSEVRYAICSIVMQRVVGMTHITREDQQRAHTYALQKFECD